MDFCCYHLLWIQHKITLSKRDWPSAVKLWFTEISNIGFSKFKTISEREAENLFDEAQESAPYGFPEGRNFLLQSKIIFPTNYVRDATDGLLLSINDKEIILKRNLENEKFAYLHFPIEGFEVRSIRSSDS